MSMNIRESINLVTHIIIMQIVARVRFAQRHYTVREQDQFCVQIINDLPIDRLISVSYSFSELY